MPRKPTTPSSYAEVARRKFLRGTAHTSPHEAIQAGARTEEEWAALLEGQHARLWSRHNQKARRNVKARHPMKGESHSEAR